MRTIAVAVLAAVTLAGSALSVAGEGTADAAPKPTSFIPHSTGQRVYGSPIGPPIVGHAKAAHHKYAPKKPPSRSSTRAAR